MMLYGRQSISDDDIQAVVEVLRSNWLTTGPKVETFEKAVSTFVGADHAVVVNSGTAALHSAMFALGIGSGDEVIVPPMTFAATANCIVFQGGTPVFVDIDPDTFLIDPEKIVPAITEKTKAIIAVDYAGQPCDYDTLHEIARKHRLRLVSDACHSIGGTYKGRKVGTLADLSVFSFHPVKHITTGEGGMVVTNNPRYAERMKRFRNHGIDTDHRQRFDKFSWFYEIGELGYNYRLTDIQCALGISQLKSLPAWVTRRQEIAARYDEALSDISQIKPLGLRINVLPAKNAAMPRASNSKLHALSSPPSYHAYHLYVVKLQGKDRNAVFRALRSNGIGVNVHYIPVHLHPYYRKRFKTGPGLCPVTETAYEQILSLPMFPKMTDEDVETVMSQVIKIVS